MDTPVEGVVFFTCSACAARYPLNWTLAGKTVHCKVCGQIVTVEAAQLVIPTRAPADAVRQIRDSLTEAAAMTATVHELLLQHTAKQEQEVAERQAEWQSLVAVKEAAIASLNTQIKELEALLQANQAGLARQEAEIRELLERIQAQEKQTFELALALKAREEKIQSLGQKEHQLKALGESIEVSLKKDIDAHQNLLANLRQQLKFG